MSQFTKRKTLKETQKEQSQTDSGERTIPLATILKKTFELTIQALSAKEILLLCFTLAWGLVGTVNALLQRAFIDAALVNANTGRFDPSATWPALCWLGGLILVFAMDLIMRSIDERKSQVIWRKVAMWCEETLITKASTMEFRYFNHQETLNRLTRANNEFSNRIRKVLDSTFKVVSSLISVLSVLVLLLTVKWYIPLMLVAASIPSILLYRLQTQEAYSSAVHTTGSTRRLWYFLTLLTTRGALKEIRFNGIHDYLCKRHDECAEEVIRIRLKIVKNYALFNMIGNLFRYSGFFAILVITVNLILKGSSSIGTLALVLSGAATLQSSFMAAANSLADIRDSGRYFQDYLTVIEAHDEGCSDPQELHNLDIHMHSADIACKDLWFTYPGNKKPTLKGINLSISQGERIAIVGENGSGKSTFISLLCGLFKPDKGKLTIAEKNVYAEKDYTRKIISAALQEFQKYEMDVESNIRIGNPYRKVTFEEIESACRLIGIHDVISSWPDGYKTHLGQLKEGKQDLSGGEWQKLVITRTLMKSEARILVLDEPTASLDPPSEAALYSAYNEIAKDRTSILISHRLGSCKIADRILVFHEGQIIEQGNHAELMAQKGQYYNMFTAQASWYN